MDLVRLARYSNFNLGPQQLPLVLTSLTLGWNGYSLVLLAILAAARGAPTLAPPERVRPKSLQCVSPGEKKEGKGNVPPPKTAESAERGMWKALTAAIPLRIVGGIDTLRPLVELAKPISAGTT